MPIPASVQNFRREMYLSLRQCSQKYSLMEFSLVDIHKLVQIKYHVREVRQRRPCIAAGGLFLEKFEVTPHLARCRLAGKRNAIHFGYFFAPIRTSEVPHAISQVTRLNQH